MARHCNLEADEFVHFIGNGHIYSDHVEQLKEQTNRVPMAFPKILIKRRHDNINDYCMDDIEWIDEYKSHDKIPMTMSV